MRVRLNRNQPNAKQKEVLKEECRREFYNLLETYNKQVALQVMHILHFDYGVPDICEIQLRDAGIRFEDFFEMGESK